ncbi:TPA: hypothetical protein EYN98_33085 [Candidatus Poribacteria bacterium]|nr:hypothetical protein [Candidatus Poribacteria bacterium]HIC00673.1 hypothetical protein [Candidatus Poribacteria bacterium]HIO07772.1 hypothetical protein [Candidatus Poribacteria bacterium]
MTHLLILGIGIKYHAIVLPGLEITARRYSHCPSIWSVTLDRMNKQPLFRIVGEVVLIRTWNRWHIELGPVDPIGDAAKPWFPIAAL